MELWILLALHAKALILCQVPVKDIQLDRRHCIEIAFEDLHWLIMPAYIN